MHASMHRANEEYLRREHAKSDCKAAKPRLRMAVVRPSGVVIAEETRRQGRASMHGSFDGRALFRSR